MRCTRSGIFVCTAVALILSARTASADRFPPDPVEELRLALRPAPGLEPDEIQKVLTKRIDALRTLSDMRRALLLDAWRDDDPVMIIARIHRMARGEIARRFGKAVRAVLQTGDPVARCTVAVMIAEIGVSAKGIDNRSGLMREFAPDLAEALKNPDVRKAAARALGLINPDPAVAVPALARLVESRLTSDRAAAAEALRDLLRVAAANSTRSRTTSGVELSQDEILALATAVVPVVSRGLNDDCAELRALFASGLHEAAATLGRIIPDPRAGQDQAGFQLPGKQALAPVVQGLGVLGQLGAPPLGAGSLGGFNVVPIFIPGRAEFEVFLAELTPLMSALAEQGRVLARSANDCDFEVRVEVRRALEEIGYARYRLWRLLGGAFQIDQEGGPLLAMLNAMRLAIPALTRGLKDCEVLARLTALDALETLGVDAAPAAPALVKALCDPDRFVRWASARILGRIGAVQVDTAVPALVHLLDDSDLDLRRAATVALGRFGPAARAAIPALIRALLTATDAEMRIAVIHSLGGIGTDARPAIPALAKTLSDPDARVRQTAAELLGKFGPSAREAVPALRCALNDESEEVRKAASDSLLNILLPALP
jgi:HEAT repeat protein